MPTRPLTCGQLVEAVNAFKESGGNYSAAGRMVGVSRDAFRNRMRHAEAKGLTKLAPVVEQGGYRTHCYIPDVQAKPGVPLDHLTWAGKYIAEKKPDVVIISGDFADMSSLSSFDRGKRAAENKRYKHDIEAAHKAMELLMTPIVMEKDYNPRLILTLGNHEHRITRFANDTPEMHEAISIKDLGYEAWGFEVYPFLEVVKVDGIAYSHYFYVPNTSRAYGGTAHTKLKNVGMSFTMGHQQGIDIAMREMADGTRQIGLVAGSFYQHFEDYRGPQANAHWQGIVMKHEVKDGEYDPMLVSLGYLKRRYG